MKNAYSVKTKGKLYFQARKIVLQSNNFSIAHLQRKLGVGYNRAREIVEVLKEDESCYR